MYRTIAKKVFWEFDSIIMQNLSDILPSFCTQTWPSRHVSENQELNLPLSVSHLAVICLAQAVKPSIYWNDGS